MRTPHPLVREHAELFPEEWYLTGTLQHDVVHSDAAERYAAHLAFYRAHLFAQPTEQAAKWALRTAYHLIKDEPFSPEEVSEVRHFLRSRTGTTLDRAEHMARADCTRALHVYAERFPDAQEILSDAYAYDAQPYTHALSPLPCSWDEWLRGLYGLTPFSRTRLEDEAHELRDWVASLPLHTSSTPVPIDAAPTLVAILEDIFDIHVAHATVRPLPEYLQRMIPSAAAYSLNRFAGTPCRITMLRENTQWNLATLLILLAHEHCAHLWHFQEVDTSAPAAARIPAMFRYPVTEAVALLTEAQVAHDAPRIEEACGRADVPATGLAASLIRQVHVMRLRRIARALFENYLYAECNAPEEALERAAKIIGEPAESLEEDFFAFLPTPGYASTYYHGYRACVDAGITALTPKARLHIAHTGFDLQGLCEESLIHKENPPR